MADIELNLVPYPKTCTVMQGEMKLADGMQIGVQSNDMLALAGVFVDEIAALTGLKFSVTTNVADAQIVFKLDSNLGEEHYSVLVDTDRAVVCGGSLRAIAWGSVTISQLAGRQDACTTNTGRQDASITSLPCASITDYPDSTHRGMMLDLARNWHPIEVIRESVVLCRWYKVKYLHLHFTDDPSWTLPSAAFPDLPSVNRHYSREELVELEDYANACGVTIIPEIDVPGHAKCMVAAIPDLVATSTKAEGVICPARESTYETLDTLIGEVLDIFKATPYFHIGADEVDMTAWTDCEFCHAYMVEHGIKTEQELYRHFIVRMRDIVSKHGKQTVVWEGFAVDGEIEIPKDIMVMAFESHYEHPGKLLSSGYTVVNTSWQPLYVVNDTNWSPEKIYSWNIYRWEHFWEKSMAHPDGIDVPTDSNVVGAQLCAWEQPAEREIPSLRLRLAAMSERIWNVSKTREDFAFRSKNTDDRLTDLL
jgi:hexosaminidase